MSLSSHAGRVRQLEERGLAQLAMLRELRALPAA